MLSHLSAICQRPGIGMLRERWPMEGWRSVRNGFGWSYETPGGRQAYCVAFLSPRYDGDDEGYTIRLQVREPTGELWIL